MMTTLLNIWAGKNMHNGSLDYCRRGGVGFLGACLKYIKKIQILNSMIIHILLTISTICGPMKRAPPHRVSYFQHIIKLTISRWEASLELLPLQATRSPKFQLVTPIPTSLSQQYHDTGTARNRHHLCKHIQVHHSNQ